MSDLTEIVGPIWRLVWLLSIAPACGVFFWDSYIRRDGGACDFHIDSLIYLLLAVIFGLLVWIIYLVAT